MNFSVHLFWDFFFVYSTHSRKRDILMIFMSFLLFMYQKYPLLLGNLKPHRLSGKQYIKKVLLLRNFSSNYTSSKIYERWNEFKNGIIMGIKADMWNN